MSSNQKPFYLQLSFLYVVFFFVNLLNFLDRGIIPGATNEINKFIEDHVDTDTPDVYLGLLQSAFIIGFMVGSVVYGHLIHTRPRFTLTATGCGIWIGAVIASGCAFYLKSYAFLIIARVFSGVGEASLQCCIPPWIQTTAPMHRRGMWLAVFYTAIPVGTALGYAYSSILAESVGWQYAFFFEALLMFPFVLFMFLISPAFPVDASQSHSHGGHGMMLDDDTDTDTPTTQQHQRDEDQLSLWQECKNICNRPVFVAVSFGTAAQTATLIGLSTFGSAFVMGLGFFDSESEASSVFGILISIAGIIATPVGGFLLDRILSTERPLERLRHDQTPSDTASDALTPLVADPDPDADSEESVEIEGEVYSPQIVSQLRKICWLVLCMACIGSLLVVSVYFFRSKDLFLFVITIGFGVLFLCNSAMNMAVMLSVPKESKSLGIALNIITLHGLGDVPAPIFVGLLKDSLAPGCIAGNDDDGNVAASDSCRDDAPGLRLCMLLASLWLLWFVFWFFVAWLCTVWQYYAFYTGPSAGSKGPYAQIPRDDGGEGGGRRAGRAVKERRGEGREGEETVISSIWDIQDTASNVSSAAETVQENTHHHTTKPSTTYHPVYHDHDRDLISDKENIRTNSTDSIPPPYKMHSRVLSKEELPHATLREQQQNVDRFKRISRESLGQSTPTSSPHPTSRSVDRDDPGSGAGRNLSWLSSPEDTPEMDLKKKKLSLGNRIRNKILGKSQSSSKLDSMSVDSIGGGLVSRGSSSTLSLSPTVQNRTGETADPFYDTEDIIVI